MNGGVLRQPGDGGAVAERLLKPERLRDLLGIHLDRREERNRRRRKLAAEFGKRAAESEVRLKRLYQAIESGVADLADPALKTRIEELKATRDQAQADTERATVTAGNAEQAITPEMLNTFARTARRKMRAKNGGYRRDHLRALAQRVEVDTGEVRIIGSKNDLLNTLATANSAATAANGVRAFGPKWRRESPPVCHVNRLLSNNFMLNR